MIVWELGQPEIDTDCGRESSGEDLQSSLRDLSHRVRRCQTNRHANNMWNVMQSKHIIWEWLWEDFINTILLHFLQQNPKWELLTSYTWWAISSSKINVWKSIQALRMMHSSYERCLHAEPWKQAHIWRLWCCEREARWCTVIDFCTLAMLLQRIWLAPQVTSEAACSSSEEFRSLKCHLRPQ